ncbi:MAG: NADH-dependent butanol dehydrogenase [Lachnospiraceae bacterium]|nr:NADH-dependent butanol dehydrogenase [Lachnospiraceae bacterium]
MNSFEYKSPTELIFGKDSEYKVVEMIKKYNGSKVLVHHDSGYLKNSGFIDKVINILIKGGLSVIELGGVCPNPRLSKVYEGIMLCKREGVDFLLPIGGGSAVDSAKAISLGIKYDGDVWDFYVEDNGVTKAVPVESVPIGVIISIPASGSEASNSSVITNDNEHLKRFCDVDIIRPKFAIQNPELTMSLSAYQTGCGIIDIMSHSFERYFTRGEGHYLTDRLCEAIFHTCMDCGRILTVNPKDYDARASIMLTATLSHIGLTGLGRAGDWATHQIGHELSGKFDMTHGAAIGIVTCAWMKYVYKEYQPIFLKWATRVMGVEMNYANPDATITEAINRLEAFMKLMSVPTRLSDVKGLPKIDDELIQKLALRTRITNNEGSVGTFKKLSPEDIANVIRLAI